MLKRDPTKPKKCAVCREPFMMRSAWQKVCGPSCSEALVTAVRNKAERKAAAAERVKDRAKKEALKTRSDHVKAAQVAFNAYVRARDMGKPCICCGKPLDDPKVGGGFDCGHYRSVGSAPHLRFDERNAHGQTKQCNRYGAGRAVDYRLGLIARLGLAEVEALEAKQDGGKWTIPELIAIRAEYKAKLKQLQREHP